MATPNNNGEGKLKKALGLFDVYAICTGAMFSSGFFLLPGLAAAQTGSSVALAYLLAGILMLPAMFSMAELSTAMPRAGGDYYFLDRAMGPLIGTVGGTGSYLALALKSAFALIGMGAYLALFMNINITFLAVVLTVAFTALNIFGAKETTGLQRILIVVLVSVMAVFIVGGIFQFFEIGLETVRDEHFIPFLSDGIAGLLGTVGFVFVSYAGLTKIASVAEEVKNPGRNIPLGMMLSIISTTIIYVVGILVMIAVLPVEDFQSSLTPVADAADAALGWLPGDLGVLLVVISATAAFASTGNAGILAASRYPMAMGRDRLMPSLFANINARTQTPIVSILFTSALMIVAIMVLDESAIAKVASTFQLLIFMLVNFAVIVMRESRIEFYDPSYRTPLYPWMQIAGVLASLFLISYIGTDALVSTLLVIVAAIAWYAYHANDRVVRDGAIFHWFSRLGERRYVGLEHELREIVSEQDVRDEDLFDQVVARAHVIDMATSRSFEDVTIEASRALSQDLNYTTEELVAKFLSSTHHGDTPIAAGASMPNLRLEGLEHTEMVLVRCSEGFCIDDMPDAIHAVIYVVSPYDYPGQHVRIMSQVARHVDDGDFMDDWLAATNEQELKEALLRSEYFLSLLVRTGTDTGGLVGKALRDLNMPESTLVALIRRRGRVVVPRGRTVLEDGDRLTIIGDPADIHNLYRQYANESTLTGSVAGD